MTDITWKIGKASAALLTRGGREAAPDRFADLIAALVTPEGEPLRGKDGEPMSAVFLTDAIDPSGLSDGTPLIKVRGVAGLKRELSKAAGAAGLGVRSEITVVVGRGGRPATQVEVTLTPRRPGRGPRAAQSEVTA
jgi:hypothetical protein